jgi:hypothetical protein
MPRSNSQIAPIHVLLVVIGAVAILVNAGGQYFRKPIVPKETEVFFSPKGGCTEAVVNEIRRATRSVLVQAYSFTSAPIAKALVDAHQRGLDVKIILDKSILSEHYSEGDFTAHAGIPTWVDKRHAIAHNKVMIIDGDTVITGSFSRAGRALCKELARASRPFRNLYGPVKPQSERSFRAQITKTHRADEARLGVRWQRHRFRRGGAGGAQVRETYDPRMQDRIAKSAFAGFPS